MEAAGIGLFMPPKASNGRSESLFSTQLMAELAGQAQEPPSRGAEVRGVSASECSGPAREGPIWGGQGHSMWEHPGYIQQTAPFLFVLWNMFQEGAEVPGEDAKAVGGEGQVLGGAGPGLPYGSVALAPAFSQDLPEQRFPWDLLWMKGRSHL